MNKLKPISILVCLVVALLLAVPSQAQYDAAAMEEHMQQVLMKIKQKRDSAMRVLLNMSDEQAKAFWPLQQQYDKELRALGKQDRELTNEFNKVYDKLNEKTAKSIGQRFFSLEKERLDLQEKYLQLISDQVSPVVAVQFIQLERRFEAQLETERMKYSPLAE